MGSRSRFARRAHFLAWLSHGQPWPTELKSHHSPRRKHHAHSRLPTSRFSSPVSSRSSRWLRPNASVPAGGIDGPLYAPATASASGTAVWVYFAIAAAAVAVTLLVQYVLHLVASNRDHSNLSPSPDDACRYWVGYRSGLSRHSERTLALLLAGGLHGGGVGGGPGSARAGRRY